MALQTPQDFNDVVLFIDDGAGGLISPCGFDTLTFGRNANTNTSTRYDCENRADPGVEVSKTTSVSQTLSGSGTISQTAVGGDAPAIPADAKTWLHAVGKLMTVYLVFFEDGATNNDPTAIGYYALPETLIQSFTNTGNRGSDATFDVALVPNTAINDDAWTDGAP